MIRNSVLRITVKQASLIRRANFVDILQSGVSTLQTYLMTEVQIEPHCEIEAEMGVVTSVTRGTCESCVFPSERDKGRRSETSEAAGSR